MARQLHHAARLAAFALAVAAALHFGLQILAGVQQCQAWETCPW